MSNTFKHDNVELKFSTELHNVVIEVFFKNLVTEQWEYDYVSLPKEDFANLSQRLVSSSPA